MSTSKYDADGRCIETQIGLIVCSPGPLTGAPDPTTQREYRLYCPSCKSFCFYEDKGGFEVRCSGCDKICGIINDWSELLQ
jgi:hypothetical protein